MSDADCQPLYTSPPQRQWVGLTWEEAEEISKPFYGVYGFRIQAFTKAIEDKLKEKNT